MQEARREKERQSNINTFGGYATKAAALGMSTTSAISMSAVTVGTTDRFKYDLRYILNYRQDPDGLTSKDSPLGVVGFNHPSSRLNRRGKINGNKK